MRTCVLAMVSGVRVGMCVHVQALSWACLRSFQCCRGHAHMRSRDGFGRARWHVRTCAGVVVGMLAVVPVLSWACAHAFSRWFRACALACAYMFRRRRGHACGRSSVVVGMRTCVLAMVSGVRVGFRASPCHVSRAQGQCPADFTYKCHRTTIALQRAIRRQHQRGCPELDRTSHTSSAECEEIKQDSTFCRLTVTVAATHPLGTESR
jgi:hypothetical protein